MMIEAYAGEQYQVEILKESKSSEKTVVVNFDKMFI